MPLYIYRSIFRDQRPEPPSMIINGYGDSLVANTGSSSAVFLNGCQELRKAKFQVTDTREYLIPGGETMRMIWYIHFTKIIPPRLTQQPKMHAHLKEIRTKTSRQKAERLKDQGLIHLRFQPVHGMVLINGMKHRLPIMKENVQKEFSDVFSRVGTLKGKEYHIMLMKNYVLVQHPQGQYQSRSRQHKRGNYSEFVIKESSHLFRSTQHGPTP